eukprot:366532-Chlamydomonas_euryale.AAC.9
MALMASGPYHCDTRAVICCGVANYCRGQYTARAVSHPQLMRAAGSTPSTCGMRSGHCMHMNPSARLRACMCRAGSGGCSMVFCG